MGISRRELIVERLAFNRRELDQVMGRISQEMIPWAPGEGVRTFGGQLCELLSVEIPLVPFLRDGKSLSWEEADALIGDMNDLANLKRRLVEVRASTLEFLGALSDAELEAPVSGEAWFWTYWRPEMPRAEIFLNIAEHERYHIGQMISYLWMRGDDPYKW